MVICNNRSHLHRLRILNVLSFKISNYLVAIFFEFLSDTISMRASVYTNP